MTEATGPDLVMAAQPARREHVPLGILYMLGATLMFAGSSAVSKWLVAAYPVGEVLFTRTAVALLACALFILPQTGLAVYRTKRLSHHMMRSVSQGFSQTFLLIAFSLMPLASAIAINFSAPLFATLVSALLLKEAVGLSRWAALLIGFCGVLIVTQPGADRGMVFQQHALSAHPAHGVLRAAAALGMGLADAGRRRMDRVQRRLERRGAILVDARAAPCAGFGGGAVLLSLADLGEHSRLCGVGRPADRPPRHRLDRGGGVRPVPDLAREQRPAGEDTRQRVITAEAARRRRRQPPPALALRKSVVQAA